jgi:TolB-like protein/Flp pilus assembly protein TadD
MKRCPECRRDYADDTLLYCLEDGMALVQGSVGSPDEPQTAILHQTAAPNEAATRAQIFTTGGEPREYLSGPPDSPSPAASRAAKPLIAAGIVLAVLVVGFFGYRYLSSADSEQVNSIAVLPFENRSGSSDTDYLSDGLADSLIYRLSQLPNLKVSPTSSVMRYKGKETDVAQIARELNVDAVMSGRLVQRADDLSISVQLIDSRTEKLIWAEQYERKMSDLLTTQREIATTITQKLQLKFGDGESKGITKKYTDNNEAYQAYLKGRYYWNRRTAENLRKGIEQFKSATDKDPNFALAYSGLADCYSILPEYAGIPPGETLPQALANAERAIAIDDQLAEAHASLGQVYKMSWKWEDAEREYKRAIELNPNYATAYHWYSHVLRNLGRYDEALAIIKRGHELDPLSSIISANVAEIYRLQNDHQASIDTCRKIIEIDPNFPYAYVNLGLSSLDLGRNSEAITNLEKATELSNRASFALMNLGYGYAVANKRTEALATAKELEERHARNESPGVFVAAVYSGLGDKDKAFAWIEKDVQEKGDLGFVRWRIAFEPLRDDPRFKDLMKRMGLPE